ncbi:MAG: energy transducer TonB [Desulfobacterales bacterium]|nr:energy transducer TonB [Desulfobacterales bacterium]
MRRLLFAALAAIGIHGLLFVWDFDLTVVPHRHEPEPRALNMILISPAPEKPVEHPRNSLPRTPVPPPPKQKAPKPVHPVQKPPVTPAPTERPSEESIAASETQPQVEAYEPVRPVPPERSGSETAVSGSENLSNIVREAVPIYRSNAPPAYPRSARKRGWQGTVMLEILVDVEGSAKDIRINESSGYDVLDEAAMSAAKKWMFLPGMRGDAPVEMWVRVPVTFQLQ